MQQALAFAVNNDKGLSTTMDCVRASHPMHFVAVIGNRCAISTVVSVDFDCKRRNVQNESIPLVLTHLLAQ